MRLVYHPAKARGKWQPSQLPEKQLLQRPYPLFKKLDESVIKLERGKLKG